MKINTILKSGIFGSALLFCCQANTKIVEYYEDAYAQQAPLELVDKVAHVADKIVFSKDYEMIVPKKPGLQINPVNKIIGYGINPQTKNPFIIINPEWFSTLNKEQQDFLIARGLLTLDNSKWHTLPKLFTPLWIIIFLALGVLAFFILKKKFMVGKPTWMIVLATLVPLFIIDTVLGPVHTKMGLNISRRFDAQMARMALDKLNQEKQVALDTFKKMDDFVKKELDEGNTFWKQYENTFADLVNRLK
ncbi:MAG: hypothetical protein AMXMBFR12_03870 [Candidatus Babeliales bacterium]